MLATLALEAGHTVSCTALADELYGSAPPDKLGNALQANATRLRKVLRDSSGGDSVLHAVHNGYVLDVPPDMVDASRFQRLAKEGSRILPDSPQEAIQRFEAALTLWRGPALLDAGDGLTCRSAAARLEEVRLTLWEDLISAWIMLREGRRVLADLKQFVERYPLRERFCEQMMLALYRSGQQSEALNVFHRTRERLDEELGLEPKPFLRKRYQEILEQDPGLMGPDVVTRWRQDYVTET
ncbi:MAG TPA: AfsR/SARP family transcriptional regulator [Streptosporangiaceae bacterium]